MKSFPIRKTLILAGIAVATSLVTRQVTAQRRGAARPITHTTVSDPSVWYQPPKGGIDFGISSSAMKGMQVVAVGNEVEIDAEAYIKDIRPGMTYVWSIRVLDAVDHKKVLVERRYDDQVFSIPDSQVLEPTFRDRITVNLPDGNYMIEAVIYEVDPKFGGLLGLNDPEQAFAARGPQRKQKVYIGQR